MGFEISDYVDVTARLANLPRKQTADLTSKVLLLPMNFAYDDDVDLDFVYYPRLSGEAMRALSDAGVPVSFIGEGSDPEEILAKSITPDFLLPTLFFGFSLYTQNPHLIGVAINVLSHYTIKALETFDDSFRPNQVIFNAVIETDEERTTKRYSYRGPVSGLPEVANMIRAASEQDRSQN